MPRSFLISALCLLLIISAIAQPPAAINAYKAGKNLKDKSKCTEALVYFKKAITLYPSYKEALFDAGWCCNELNKYNDALPYLKKAKQLMPDEAKVYLELGYANQQLDNTSDAEQFLEKCISLQEDYSLAYQYLGNLFFSEGDYEKSLEQYEKYKHYESNITNGTVYYKMGYCQNELKSYNDAIASLKKAISLKDNYTDAYNELGFSYTKLENTDDALHYFNEALRTDPNSTVALNGIGTVYKDVKKDNDMALKSFLKSLNINAENKKTNYLIGWCYNDKGRYNDAVPYLKKALEIDSKYVSALTELGYCDYALENYDDALRQFNKALDIEKTELSIYYSGLCYIGLNQMSNAVRMYDELKEMGSDYAGKLKKKIDAK
jgi:tetratricopeptide (TPR) repeat protein